MGYSPLCLSRVVSHIEGRKDFALVGSPFLPAKTLAKVGFVFLLGVGEGSLTTAGMTYLGKRFLGGWLYLGRFHSFLLDWRGVGIFAPIAYYAPTKN